MEARGDIIRRWYEALNVMDADAMVELMAPDVVVHPVRVVEKTYSGHEGVRQMLVDVVAALGRPPHAVTVGESRDIGGGRLLTFLRGAEGTEFANVSTFDDGGRIATMQHYLSTPDLLEMTGHAPVTVPETTTES